MTNLATLMTKTAAEKPESVALRFMGFDGTYKQLFDGAAKAAGQMRAAGVEPGDRVALSLPNVPSYPIYFWGALMAGAIIVPMNPLLKARECEFFYRDSGAKLAFVYPDFVEEAAKGGEAAGTRVIPCGPLGPEEGVLEDGEPITEPAAKDDNDTALILYTSGTTGTPKGAELTHFNLRSNAETCVNDILGAAENDIVLGMLPLFHVFGLTVSMLASATFGGTLVLLPRFDPAEAIKLIGSENVTIMLGVPTMYHAILHHPDSENLDASKLRMCVSGGSAMPAEVQRAFEEKFDCRILEGYGLSETSPVASFNMPDRPSKPGTIGRAIPGVKMRNVDDNGKDVPLGEVGEIAIQGDCLMKGYWNRPEATATAIPDGWFRTGDLATVDEDGYYTIVDRKKDMILRGGMNIYPREVEELLYTHPQVLEAAVVGLPDDAMGEEVGAAVTLKPDATVTPEELVAWTKERIAAYKYPRRLWVADDLPKGPTGKILRREVHPPSES